MEEASVELDGVIVLDRALVFEAADALEVPSRRGGSPGRRGVRRGPGEARIVAWEKSVHDALGLHESARMGQAELDDEAILEGAKEPFDPSLGLRRVRGDPPNAEFLERAPDLGGFRRALELLGQGERGARIAVKDAMAIGVSRGGKTIAPDQMAEQEEVALGIFLSPKDAPEDAAGRIVDRRVEHEAGAAVFEPGMVAAIHLDEEARLGHAVTAAAMPWGTTCAGTADAGLAEEPADGGTGQGQSFVLLQQLGEMVIIRAGIASAGQGEDPGADTLGEAPRRGATAVAMSQRDKAPFAQVGQKPADMSH